MKASVKRVQALIDRCLAIRNGVESESSVDFPYILNLLGTDPKLHTIKAEAECFDIVDLMEIATHYKQQGGVDIDSVDTDIYHLLQLNFNESRIFLNLISNK